VTCAVNSGFDTQLLRRELFTLKSLYAVNQCYFSFEKGSGTQKKYPKFDWRGVVLVVPMPRRKGSRTPFWLVSF
jgi:hypothetical protein